MATNSLIELPPKRAIDKPLGSPTHEELVSVDRLRSLTQRGSFRHGGTAIAVAQIFSFASRKFSLAPRFRLLCRRRIASNVVA
jgi:hypothetical protein